MLYKLLILRPVNLVIIALTQFLVRYCIIMPAYITEFNNTGVFPPHLSKTEFFLLLFATMIIAAGGYLINDVFDVHIDEVNKPGKNIIGKKISVQSASLTAYVLFTIGSIMGISIAVSAHATAMGFLLPFSAVSLYMYSSYYKRRLLTGNLVVAFLSALSVLIVALFEPHFYPNIQFILIYGIFAFIISLIREIIKDAEDIAGDERSQCKTFPIMYGIQKTKTFLGILITLNLAIIGYFLYLYFYTNTVINFWYLVGIFAIPFIGLGYLVSAAETKKDFHYASVFAKFVMLYGILTMVPFYWYFLK
ncbi:MAG: geranylgeranylglycerol-phosphate geranylgeranyltransferase [Bacteroidota bacterium]